MNADARDLAGFGAAHARELREAHGRAGRALSVDLPLPAFTAQVYAAAEAVFGDPRKRDRRMGRFLAALHTDDLYLAAAAAGGSPAARATLERWFGPFLDELGREAGRDDLVAELLASDGDAPLRHYLGLCSLKRWLRACAARALAPAPPQEPPLAGPVDPEARRAFDHAPAHALAAVPAGLRLAVLLHLSAAVPVESAATSTGRTTRSLHSDLRRLVSATVAEIDAALRRGGLSPADQRRAWKQLTLGYGLPDGDRAEAARRLLRGAGRRTLAQPVSDGCPDPNLLAGALEPVPALPRAALFDHATRCPACLHAVATLGPPAPRRPAHELRLRPVLAGAALVLAAVAGAGLLLARHLGEDDTATAPRRTEAAEIIPAVAAAVPEEAAVPPPAAATPPAAPPPASTPAPAQRSAATPTERERPRPTRASPTPDAVVPPLAPAPRVEPTATPAPLEPMPASAPAILTPVATATPASSMPPLELRIVRSDSRAAKLVNLALGRYRLGEESAALSVVDRALDLEPELGEAHFNAALLYERSGDAARARLHWMRYLQLAPPGAELEAVRERLGR